MPAHKIIELDDVDSTNTYAFQAFLAHHVEPPFWVSAKRQHQGRGRSGVWLSAEGNLCLSLLLCVDFDPRVLPQLSFVAGLALYDALATCLPDHQALFSLKWPNDILCEGKKVAGVLIESRKQASDYVVVIGWGVNCASYPSETRWPATSLSAFGGAGLCKPLSTVLAETWETCYTLWQSGAGFSEILALWHKRAYGLGRRAELVQGENTFTGIIRGIDGSGALMIERDDGYVHTFVSGEVRLIMVP